MTLSSIWKKLRKKNIDQYRQFRFCFGLAIGLISSFLFMQYSPLVQNTLPAGGDSRKQILMIFGIAAAGCTVFILYAAALFLRYKSKEVGVFLALGMPKNKIAKSLYLEIGKNMVFCWAAGLAGGAVISLILGKVFEQIAKDAGQKHFSLTWTGLAGTVLYGILVFLLVLAATVRFMKRSNVMEIINTQRRQEPLKDMVTFRYLAEGILFFAVGILLGFLLPSVVVNVFHHWMGPWTNLFYLFVLWGLYRIMVYSVSCHRKRRNPQKYYKNLIAYGMLKFQGKSIVKNMLVITLLLMGGLFAMDYIPLNGSQSLTYDESYEADYAFRYTQNASELTRDEIEAMAADYGLTVENYREAVFVETAASGINRDYIDENGNLQEVYEDKTGTAECISSSQYKLLTGTDLPVKDGTYYMIQEKGAHETVFNHFDDMDKLYLQDGKQFLPMKYAGNTIYQCLVIERGFDYNARYVLSDGDYEKIRRGAEEKRLITQVLFDTEKGEQAVAFSKELYREFGRRISENMNVGMYYDEYRKEKSGESDSMYGAKAVYDPDNAALDADWQYEPVFIYLEQKNFFVSMAVYFLLFLYVAVICLAAVGVVSYTRSQGMALAGRQTFEDLTKLGADCSYQRNLIRKQVRKIFVLPTWIGCIGMSIFVGILVWNNDKMISYEELLALGMIAGLTGLAGIYQYVVYRFSMKKVREILHLETETKADRNG